MVSNDSRNPGLGEAAARFLAQLSLERREASQQEVHKFARWYGWEQPFRALTAPGVANYAEGLPTSDTDYTRKLALVRAFLAYAKKVGWTKVNLGAHLKARKTKAGSSGSASRLQPEAVALTQQGYTEMKTELAVLKERSIQLIDEIRRAAADKDFRENAPLAAAREERGYVEGRIMELEAVMKVATIIDGERKSTLKVGIGDSIVLCDTVSGEELRYRLVDPREVDASKGKISSASPIGKAVMGCDEGEVIEITVPAGKLRYQIRRVER